MDIEMLGNMSQEEAIEKIFSECDDNEEIYDLCCSELGFDIEDVMLFAVQNNKVSFVEEYVDDLDDVNGEDGYCTYLLKTDNEEIKDIFTDRGAFYPDYYYSGFRFAYCTVNDFVEAFDPDFQKEVFEKVLEYLGLTEEEFCEHIENPDDYEDSLSFEGYDLEETADILGVIVEDGEISFDDDTYNKTGSLIREIVDALGYNTKFDGISWKLETRGYYYVE